MNQGACELSLFVGEVRHRRLRPVEHQFTYRGFFFRIDAALLDPALSVDSLHRRKNLASETSSKHPVLASHAEAKGQGAECQTMWRTVSLFNLPLFAINRSALISMHAKDHGSGQANEPLSQWLLGLLEAHKVETPQRIRLVAYPRVLGYQFKPVSFWFCEDAQGECTAIVAEVRNTFSGRHAYVLTPGQLESAAMTIGSRAEGHHTQGKSLPIDRKTAAMSKSVLKNGQTLTTSKCFTVSPFCTISGEYRFRFYNGDDRNLARIDYHDNDGLLLTTSMSGRRSALSRRNLLKFALGIPWQSLLVMLRIHWQAFLLWLKKVPFYGAHQTPIPPQSLPS